MKKFIPLILAAALCLPFAALAEDAVSSASVADFYGQTALTGDQLIAAVRIRTRNRGDKHAILAHAFHCVLHRRIVLDLERMISKWM